MDGRDELVQAARDVFNIPIGGGMMGVTLLSLNCKECQCIHSAIMLCSSFSWLTPLMRLIATCIPLRSLSI